MPKRGTGVYHRKNGSWEARYVKGYDDNGKKIYGSVYAKSCREAKEKRQEKEDQIRLFQREICTRKITVTQLVEEWLRINATRIRRSSYQKYEGFLSNHIVPIIGARPVLYLTHINLSDFANNRLNAGLSPQSVNAILTFLHTCFKYGQRHYQLPMPIISRLAETKSPRRALTEDEQKRLLDVLMQNADISHLGILLALFTGLRMGELCALKWGDITDGCLFVRATMQRLKRENEPGTEIYIGPPKSETSIRTIPVPDFLQTLIEPFRRGADDYFLGTPSRPIVEPRVMHYRLKRFLKAAEITGVSAHNLRHTFATIAAASNMQLRVLSEILGHSSTKITADIYLHPSLELKRKSINALVPDHLTKIAVNEG